MLILRPLLILFLVSASISGCFFLLGFPFWPVFGLSSIFQIFGYNLFNKWVKQKAEIEFESITNERIKEFSKMGLDSTCPNENCGHKAFVPIRLDEENIYKCPKCNNLIKVLIGAKSFLTTTPLDEDPFKNFNFSEGKDYDN